VFLGTLNSAPLLFLEGTRTRLYSGSRGVWSRNGPGPTQGHCHLHAADFSGPMLAHRDLRVIGWPMEVSKADG
jgi:hypothetical protein